MCTLLLCANSGDSIERICSCAVGLSVGTSSAFLARVQCTAWSVFFIHLALFSMSQLKLEPVAELRYGICK